MIEYDYQLDNMLLSPARKIDAKVELYKGSALVATYSNKDDLQSIIVERSGDQNKFLGYGVSQKATIKILDKAREKNIDSNFSFKIYFGCEEERTWGIEEYYATALPTFYISDVSRDEITNTLTITGNDYIEALSKHKMSELNFNPEVNYTVRNHLEMIAAKMGFEFDNFYDDDALGELTFKGGANFGEEETFRQIIDAAAALCPGIYFVNQDNKLTFKFVAEEYVEVINKPQYFDLKIKERVLYSKVISTNDLSDNIVVSSGVDGESYYLINNPFLIHGQDDKKIVEVLEWVLNWGNLGFIPFEITWRGNPFLEIGDGLMIQTKDGNPLEVFFTTDTIEYDGGLRQTTSWTYEGDTEGSIDAPNYSSLGEALSQTFARVDKANKEIQLLVSSVDDTETQMAQLKLTTNEISANVSKTKQSVENMEESVSNLQQSVEAKLSADEVNIKINEALENGVESVATSTGFKFNKDGLNITKENSDISTLIDEDGMDISKGSEKVLVADNQGVEAINLTAKQYLIIGDFSRFENYGENRTGCFWIGG